MKRHPNRPCGIESISPPTATGLVSGVLPIEHHLPHRTKSLLDGPTGDARHRLGWLR
jgi:hypothetical protein